MFGRWSPYKRETSWVRKGQNLCFIGASQCLHHIFQPAYLHRVCGRLELVNRRQGGHELTMAQLSIELFLFKGSVTGISQIFGPNYPEISGSQLNPFRTLSLNIISKGRYNLNSQRRKQTTAINIDFLKTRGNNLKSLASIFQVAILFHPGHLQPKTLANSFIILI